ncbi:MAG: NTP transferase domain-containing protein [Bacteroidetes bacterium]|nr:NTP transferase domain-containing protein [Bacteroidota bacterium]
MAHQKHAKITRPDIGHYHRNEWAILGAPCGRIDELVSRLTQHLSAEFRIGYIDADHQAKDPSADSVQEGAFMAYTNKIEYHRWDCKNPPTDFEAKIAFRKLDMLLVNGNHFLGNKQILILDERKFDSLQRKKDRLTDVQLILTTPELDQLPDFLQDHIDGHADIPRLGIEDTKGIASFLQQNQKHIPLKGLVLAGGKSTRMGKDKGELVYHEGQSQRKFVYDLLQGRCDQVYLSCREDQVQELSADFQTLPDKLSGLGPFAAILSAFQSDPNAAWLVVACDLPFVSEQAIDTLIQARNPSMNATAFHNPDSGFPEPLITIWEPRAYPDLLSFLSLGYSCPRKVLINTDVEEIQAENLNWIRNVNTPEELKQAMEEIK